MLLKITLKCMSLRVVLDLLNQILNVDVIWFTTECGNPGMLKSMFSVLIARLNSFTVLNNAILRFSPGENCSFHCVCIWAVSLNRLSCSMVSLLNTGVFCQIIKFPRSITDLFGSWLGLFGEFYTLNFSTKLLNEFTNWLLFNCRTCLIHHHSEPIVIVS